MPTIKVKRGPQRMDVCGGAAEHGRPAGAGLAGILPDDTAPATALAGGTPATRHSRDGYVPCARPHPLVELKLEGWPFSLHATLNSGQVFHWHPCGDGFAGMIDTRPVYVAQPAQDKLRCTRGAAEAVRQYFALDHDMESIIASFPAGDEILRRAVAWGPGLRLIRQPPWECLATFITSSLKQVPHIRAISLRLRERFGAATDLRGLPRQYSWPTAESLAQAGEPALRACALGYRARFLHRAAEVVSQGEFSLGKVTQLDDSAALEALCGLTGVGDKIASCALLFGWERHGAFPIDVWIERVLRRLYFPRARKVTARRVREFAHRHFGPYRGYAQQFLFHWARLTNCGERSVSASAPP